MCVAKRANFGLQGLSGALKKDELQFGHPYTLDIHGSVLFCRDCWEEEGG